MPARGQKLSEEARALISEAKRRAWADPDSKYNSPETRDLWSQQRTGVPATPEAVARRAASNRGKRRSPEQIAAQAARWTPEARRAHAEALRGQWNGRPALGSYLDPKGYVILTGRVHPLARLGKIYEHRQVLYDKIGPGPHYCHWECGRLLDWDELQADHLDGDQSNNDPSNLVPSCLTCNQNRARAGNPVDWHA